jgi:hypothetical protein
MRKNIIEPDRPQITIWHMRIALPKATKKHSEHVTLIAFPLQKCFHEHASLLRYTCIACLVYNCEVCLLRGTNRMFKYNCGKS